MVFLKTIKPFILFIEYTSKSAGQGLEKQLFLAVRKRTL